MDVETTCRVKTTDGPIIGYHDKHNEKVYYTFKRIPYALPPVEKLRFLPPRPVKPWVEDIDCTKPAPASLQYSWHVNGLRGSEDCLYIELSTPNLSPEKLMPVMFWVGSYGFSCTLDDILNPVFINEQNIVFVKCGFRLGPFGFLSINHLTAPGNCGLKDIVLALKWVQKNISVFGGDPNNVTIFGTGSGGAITHLMVLSQLTKGLFHKAVIQSASALNNWAVTKNPIEAVRKIAKKLNITKSNCVDIVEEMCLLPAEKILNAFIALVNPATFTERDIFRTIFKPCIEEEFEGQTAFLTKSPYVIIKTGTFNKVPLIFGCNNIEAALLQFAYKNFYVNNLKKINEDVNLLVPKSLSGDMKCTKTIGEQILKFYFPGEKFLSRENETQYLQLISDYYFLYYVNKTVRFHSRIAPSCPIYYYTVNYAGDWTVPENLKFFNHVGHTTDIPFIFGIHATDSSVTYCKGSRDSETTRSRVVKMWSNFAKFGNPTPDVDDPLLQIKWDPVEDETKLNYLCIGSELTKGRNPFMERMNFWDELHTEHVFHRALVHFNDMGVTW